MYKLEMHLHTKGKSPCALTDEKTVAALYAENGYDGIVCTNHFSRRLCEKYYKKGTPADNVSFYLDGYFSLQRECEKYGIDVFLGVELMTDELSLYKLLPPKAELLIYGIEPQQLLDESYGFFERDVKSLHELCVAQGWLLGQSHPFRTGITTQNPKYLDCVEAYNGHPGHINRNGKALRFAEDNGLITVAGGDFHKVNALGSGVLLQNAVHTNGQLVEELKKRAHTILRGGK